MTDTTINLKHRALELANAHGEPHAAVVARATAYHAFLSGTAAAPGAGAGTAGANKTPPAGATTNKTPPAGATTGKPNTPPAGAAKTPPAGAAGKPTTPPAGKATTPPAGKAGAAGKANASAVPGDQKAPGGKYTYQDVVNALVKVRDNATKEEAVAILKEDGGGCASVRDLKPALYDAVVEACEQALNGSGAPEETGEATTDELDMGTEQPETDEMGLAQ